MNHFSADDWVKIIGALAIALPGIIAAITSRNNNRIAKRNVSHMKRQDERLEKIDNQTNGKLAIAYEEITRLRAENEIYKTRERRVRESDMLRTKEPLSVVVKDVEPEVITKAIENVKK